MSAFRAETIEQDEFDEMRALIESLKSSSFCFGGLSADARPAAHQHALTELEAMSAAFADTSDLHRKLAGAVRWLIHEVDRAAGKPKSERSGDGWEEVEEMRGMTHREAQDRNAGSQNNTHFGARPAASGRGTKRAASDAAGPNPENHGRDRHKLPGTVASNICFDFSNGRCTRGDSCRFSHVGGVTGGRLCYNCGQRGHISKECPFVRHHDADSTELFTGGGDAQVYRFKAQIRGFKASPDLSKLDIPSAGLGADDITSIATFAEEMGLHTSNGTGCITVHHVQPVGGTAAKPLAPSILPLTGTSLFSIWTASKASSAKPFAGP